MKIKEFSFFNSNFGYQMLILQHLRAAVFVKQLEAAAKNITIIIKTPRITTAMIMPSQDNAPHGD